jgi:hypothetical protein
MVKQKTYLKRFIIPQSLNNTLVILMDFFQIKRKKIL